MPTTAAAHEPTDDTARDLELATELYSVSRDADPGLAIATIAGALAGARQQGYAAGHSAGALAGLQLGREQRADDVYATAYAEGRESVGLGDFLPDPCGDERSTAGMGEHWWSSYGPWLSCSLRSGHDGQHEHETSGARW